MLRALSDHKGESDGPRGFWLNWQPQDKRGQDMASKTKTSICKLDCTIIGPLHLLNKDYFSVLASHSVQKFTNCCKTRRQDFSRILRESHPLLQAKIVITECGSLFSV